MHPQVLIGRESDDYVKITPTRREFPDALDYWDGNWVYADVSIRVGFFRGDFEAQLRTDEFAGFSDGLGTLYKNLTGEAVFESMEKWLLLRLAGDGKGHVSGDCQAKDSPGTGNSLSFRIEIDQTDLPRILSELDAILTAYPVIGVPPS